MDDAVGIGPVVADGDYRKSLEALRDRLAAFLDGLSERQVVHAAPLSKQLADVLKEIAALPNPEAAADSVEDAEDAVAAKLRLVQ